MNLRRIIVALLTALLAGACVDFATPNQTQSAPVDQHPCGGELAPRMLVIDRLWFVGADGDVSEGVDIDGRVSDRNDDETCGQVDFVSPDGTPGVDNQFARLLPALEGVAGQDSVLAVIQRTINSGGVLLALELDRLDSLEADECVEVTVSRAKGQPSIGANGLLEEGQTYDRNPEIPASFIEDATLNGGKLTAGPFDLEMPLVVDSFELFIQIRNATVVGQFDENGKFEGIIAGSIVVPEFAQSIEEIDASADVLRLVSNLLYRLADLAPNSEGECEELSITLGISAVPGFFFDETP